MPDSGIAELFLSRVNPSRSLVFLIRKILPAIKAGRDEALAIMRNTFEAGMADTVVAHVRRVTRRTRRLHFKAGVQNKPV